MRSAFKYCEHCQKVLPLDEARQHEDAFMPNATHYVSQDTIPATEHPATGQIFESKSEFRKVTKALGYEEVGSEYAKNKQWREQGNTKSSHEKQREYKEYREGIRADVARQLAKYGVH